MAFAIPNGSRVNVAKAYQAPITFTAASNATECELTVASAAGIGGRCCAGELRLAKTR